MHKPLIPPPTTTLSSEADYLPPELETPLVLDGEIVDSSAMEHRTLERTQASFGFSKDCVEKGITGRKIKKVRELMEEVVGQGRVRVGAKAVSSISVAA
ncbi:hypothetical protein O6P43_010937 [Quillaja saponaria]|uniref:Uncharacterized protein n=1 Tax=Quillaja saponaria TaxID=32244 RepID=A0AAD7Q211_QUISA|nr:hypothetical protein O6P43_010937 [Quillaja saponaria]